MNRGNRRAVIFRDNRDRQWFDRILVNALEECDVELLCATEMTTHFHLGVQTPHGNISDFMQQLDGEFAQYSNRRHKNVGHLFQGRFKAVVIEDDIQLFTAIWYIYANPCEGRLVNRFEEWPWSTYAATVGLKPVPRHLSLSWLQTLFPAESLEASRRIFRHCMEQAEPVIAYLLAVDPTLDVAIRSYVSERIRDMKEPSSYRALFRPPLDHLFWPGQSPLERNHTIEVARVKYGYKLSEIARSAWLHPSTVSKIFRAVRSLHQESIANRLFNSENADWRPGSEYDFESQEPFDVTSDSMSDPD
jgi:REP element-mobilizing transposase RayT